MSKQVGCTPHLVHLESFHTLIALVHPLHGNPYSSRTNIDCKASPLPNGQLHWCETFLVFVFL